MLKAYVNRYTIIPIQLILVEIVSESQQYRLIIPLGLAGLLRVIGRSLQLLYSHYKSHYFEELSKVSLSWASIFHFFITTVCPFVCVLGGFYELNVLLPSPISFPSCLHCFAFAF